MLIDVAADVDLVEGTPTVCHVEGRELVLVRWRDEIFALRNICPHQSLPLARGRVHSSLRSASPSGELQADDTEPLLQCPVHAWNYSLRTGRCVVDPRLRVKTYPATVKDGRVFVDDGARDQPSATAQAERSGSAT